MSREFRPLSRSVSDIEAHIKHFGDVSGINLADENTGHATLHGITVPTVRRRLVSFDAGWSLGEMTIPFESGRRINAFATGVPTDNSAGKKRRVDPRETTARLYGLSLQTLGNVPTYWPARDVTTTLGRVNNRDETRSVLDTVAKQHMSPQFHELSKRMVEDWNYETDYHPGLIKVVYFDSEHINPDEHGYQDEHGYFDPIKRKITPYRED